MKFIQQNTNNKNIVSTNISADINFLVIMKYICYLFITTLFIISCNNKKSSQDFKPKNDIIFDVGFNPNFNFCGTVFDKKSNKELIYFAEPITNKIIKFFNSNGKIEDSISLKNLSKVTPTILSVKVISKDTLLFFNYTQVIAVNSEGNVFKLVDLQSLTQNNPLDDIYEFRSSASPNNEAYKNSLFLGLNWVKNKYHNKDLNFAEYFSTSFSKPSIIKINNFLSDSISYVLSKHNHYGSIFKSPKAFSEGFNYKLINNKLFIITHYSNCLLEYDNYKLEFKKKISINSDYTSIGAEPLNFDNPNFSSEETIEKRKMKGAIKNVFYNDQTNQYIVFVRHQIEKKFLNKEIERPFSIIKYDDTFNKISEVEINKNQFDFYAYRMIQTQSGIMILNNENTNDKKLSFSIFN